MHTCAAPQQHICYGVKVGKCQRQEGLIKQVAFEQVRWWYHIRDRGSHTAKGKVGKHGGRLGEPIKDTPAALGPGAPSRTAELEATPPESLNSHSLGCRLRGSLARAYPYQLHPFLLGSWHEGLEAQLGQLLL